MRVPKWLVPFLLLLMLGGSAVQAAPRSRHTGPSVRVRTLSRSQPPRQATITVTCPECLREGWKAKILADPVPIDARGVSHGLAFNLFAHHQATRLKRGGIGHAEFEALYQQWSSGSWIEFTPEKWVGINYWYSWLGVQDTRPTRKDGKYYSEDDRMPFVIRRLKTSFGKRDFRTTCNNPVEEDVPPPAKPRIPVKRKIRIAIQKIRLCDHGCPEGSHMEPFGFSLKLKTEVCATVQAKSADKCLFTYTATVSSDDQSDSVFQICEELTDTQKAAGWGFLSAKATNGVTEVHVNFSSPDEVVVQVTNLFRHKVTPPGPTTRKILIGVQKTRFCDHADCGGNHMEPFHYCLKQGDTECDKLDAVGGDACFFSYSVTVSSDNPNDIVFQVCEELTDVQVAAGWEFLSARSTKGVTQVRINFGSPDKVLVQVTNLFRHKVVPPPPPPVVFNRPPVIPVPKEGFIDSNGFIRTDTYTGPSIGFIPKFTTCNTCGRTQDKCHGHPGKPPIPHGPIPPGGGKPPRDPITGMPPRPRVPPGF